ncbi:hypothetical protein [Hymenobacter sp. 102]|uniref:hypothetical protein n=1 Tax=Hymenobacter sp. 102 TaxID=3403152 RepID=UPI003CF85CC3
MPDLNLYVHKDYDKLVDIVKTDYQGKFISTIRMEDLDKKSKYQIFLNEKNYEPINTEIDVNINDQINIKLVRRKLNSVVWDCSTPSFGLYVPHLTNSLAELPDSIQKKLAAYLNDRLGSNYYSRTLFAGGRVVDICRLHKVEPNSVNYKWPVHNYYLCFSIADTLGGSMAMDSTGKVTEELSFPAIGHDSSKDKIISRKKAIKIAKRNNSYDRKTEIYFGYDKKNDCFQWTFRNCKENGMNVGCSILHIAAHTGEALRTSRTTGIRSNFH